VGEAPVFDNLEVMRMAHGLAKHASGRQDVVARNIANADTPKYHTEDLAPFAELYERGDTQSLRATRAGHIEAGESAAASGLVEIAGEAAPNGNTVSLEAEMMRSAEVRHQHDMATSIYKSSLDILRTSLGRR
jgi:flagellar basal-body rod protein FlgB